MGGMVRDAPWRKWVKANGQGIHHQYAIENICILSIRDNMVYSGLYECNEQGRLHNGGMVRDAP